jgi:hypothetical protein
VADSIFEDDELAADAIAPESSEAEVETASADTRVRDDQGRFAPKVDEPEAAEEPGDDDTPHEKRQVPQGALHAERERRKAAETNYRAAQAQLDALSQMRAQIAARQPQPIDAPGEDPASETAYLRQRLEQIEGTQQTMVQRDQLSQVDQAERQHLGSLLTQSEAEYRSVKPDYDAAISHVISARAQELALYGLTPMQVQEALQQEVLDITRSAIQQGKAPAEVGYQLAMLRGYRPDAAQPGAQQQGAGQRTVEAVGQARAASRSLGQASGTGSTRDLNASTIAAMSIDEFDALYSTPEGRKLIDAL